MTDIEQARIDKAINLIQQLCGHPGKRARLAIARDAVSALRGEEQTAWRDYARSLRAGETS